MRLRRSVRTWPKSPYNQSLPCAKASHPIVCRHVGDTLKSTSGRAKESKRSGLPIDARSTNNLKSMSPHVATNRLILNISTSPRRLFGQRAESYVNYFSRYGHIHTAHKVVVRHIINFIPKGRRGDNKSMKVEKTERLCNRKIEYSGESAARWSLSVLWSHHW